MSLENKLDNMKIVNEEPGRNYVCKKEVYEKPRYALIKPLFGKGYTTTVSAVSLKR